MGLVEEQDRFLTDLARLVTRAKTLGFTVTGGELYRPPGQQAACRRAGRTESPDSPHLRRLAIDLHVFVRHADGLTLCCEAVTLKPLGDYWEALDPAANRWGGTWGRLEDVAHFERRAGRGAAAAEDPQPAAAADRRAARLLSASVGAKQPNRKDDVRTVQHLLNLLAEREDRPAEPPLKADGIFGAKTLAAVLACQTAVGLAAPDGVVEPAGPTVRHLAARVPPAFSAALLQLVLLDAEAAAVARFAPALAEAFARYGIATPLRQAHFLAQVGHESGALRFTEEIASGEAYEGRADLGNVRPGDGKRFKGRGLIQLTGRYNYARFGAALGREDEILANPGLVAADLGLCVGAAGWYWEARGLSPLADADDFRTITQRINGGFNGIEHRQALLRRAKALYGIG